MQSATAFDMAQPVYAPKIRTFARKVTGFLAAAAYDLEDLENELLEVLWRCTLAYNPDNGANFNTLFWTSAKRRLISLERHAKAQKRFAEWVRLDPEAFAAVVDRIISEFSAEDHAIANLTIFHSR